LRKTQIIFKSAQVRSTLQICSLNHRFLSAVFIIGFYQRFSVKNALFCHRQTASITPQRKLTTQNNYPFLTQSHQHNADGSVTIFPGFNSYL